MKKQISFSIAIIIIIVCAILVGGVVVWWYLKIPAETELPEIGMPLDETADWKTYRNEKIGIEFKYSPSYNIEIVDSDDIKDKNETAVVKGKAIDLNFHPYENKEETDFYFTAVTADCKKFLQFVWNGNSDISSECSIPLSYNERGNVCNVIEFNGGKAVFRNNLVAQGERVICFPYLITEIIFNNQDNSIYKGLMFSLNLQGINSYFDQYDSLDECSEEKTKEIFSVSSLLSKNIIEEMNLQEKDANIIKTVKLMLSTFRFLE